MRALAVFLVVFCCTATAQDAIAPDGGYYYGPLREGKPHGMGRLVSPDGVTYTGGFNEGLFHGRARIQERDGETYEAQFEHGRMTSRGPSTRGPRPAPHPAQRQIALDVETALLRQGPLLEQALAALAPRMPGRPNLWLLAVAGDGSHEVFRREAEFVREQFDRDFGTRGHSLVLANARGVAGRSPMATVSGIRAALAGIGARMDREQDILMVFLTSHGTGDHELRLFHTGLVLSELSPDDLAAALRESGARWRAVVVSGCVTGGFLDALADERTLVVTAARRDRASYGCLDREPLTYFGSAFFKEALPAASSFEDAFRRAAALIGESEARAKIVENERSLPQLHAPRPVSEQLARWWSQSRR